MDWQKGDGPEHTGADWFVCAVNTCTTPLSSMGIKTYSLLSTEFAELLQLYNFGKQILSS